MSVSMRRRPTTRTWCTPKTRKLASSRRFSPLDPVLAHDN